jgi:Domain of unknown function (DUF4917)
MAVSFEDAIKASDPNRTVLLGNGFSIAQAGAPFSYTSLLERSGLPPTSPIRKVFAALQTTDFEEVMHALEHAAKIERTYGDEKRASQFQTDSVAVREALINAIHEVHPGVQFDIPKAQRDACAKFLNQFVSVFTLNYDLLLYWVILHAARESHSDGFGLGHEVNGFRTFHADANCTTYYLHGALHLFLGPQLETRKRVVTNDTIVNDIASTIHDNQQLPLFVAEGTNTQKMAKINSIPYLRHCYEKLEEAAGSLFVFGHSAGNNDQHIYDAIFDSEIDKLFFCVHDPAQNLQTAKERLAPYHERDPGIDIIYVDAATAKVWGSA